MQWYAQYEKDAYSLFKAILNKYSYLSTEDIKYGNENKIKGKSCYKHQIDLSISDGTKNLLHIIECKYLRRKVSTKDVLAFAARISDINDNTDKTVSEGIVTKIGFTKNAIMLLEYFDIERSTLGKNSNDDTTWSLSILGNKIICPGPARITINSKSKKSS